MDAPIFSLGHSDLPFDRFLDILESVGVDAVADVRSSPYSRRNPCFSQPEMKAGLKASKIAYVFLGKELGGRPNSPELFRGGIAHYPAMAKTALFNSGISRLLTGRNNRTIAMVCSEKDPLHCHRCLLVGRTLLQIGINTRHIHHSMKIENQTDAEDRLLLEENLFQDDFLRPRDERLEEAYKRRNIKAAYSTQTRPTIRDENEREAHR